MKKWYKSFPKLCDDKKKKKDTISQFMQILKRGISKVEMTEQAKEARRAYKRKWARENKDKVRQAQAKYWERKAVQQAEGEQHGKEK